uniref:Uncharacterized protein n=1 Tax=Euplotes crassus TaxID=5936 RepID=A0A7S3KDI1_EUPCR
MQYNIFKKCNKTILSLNKSKLNARQRLFSKIKRLNIRENLEFTSHKSPQPKPITFFGKDSMLKIPSPVRSPRNTGASKLSYSKYLSPRTGLVMRPRVAKISSNESQKNKRLQILDLLSIASKSGCFRQKFI